MSFREAMRRVITGDAPDGKSVIIIDGGPSSEVGDVLYEIWEDAAGGPLDTGVHVDLGAQKPRLGPAKGNVQVRWFAVNPLPEGIPKPVLDKVALERFTEFGGAHHVVDQSRHPAMHETQTLDIICLLQGDASLILEDGETRLKPGNVVIQRGTNHAWHAHGGPAFFLAVLIDRSAA
jgi:hypothetical protein